MIVEFIIADNQLRAVFRGRRLSLARDPVNRWHGYAPPGVHVVFPAELSMRDALRRTCTAAGIAPPLRWPPAVK